jgi:hypothetical protein
MKHIYILGPLSDGGALDQSDQEANVNRAISAMHAIMDMGYVPFCPHLSYYADLWHTRPWSEWMRWCLAWIERCDAGFCLPGKSAGVEREMALFARLGRPVFESLEELKEATK